MSDMWVLVILTRQREPYELQNLSHSYYFFSSVLARRICTSGGSVFNSCRQVSAMLVKLQQSLFVKMLTYVTGKNRHEMLKRKQSIAFCKRFEFFDTYSTPITSFCKKRRISALESAKTRYVPSMPKAILLKRLFRNAKTLF